MTECPNCVPCATCDGRGKYDNPFVYDGVSYCPDCGGSGVEYPCDVCRTELDEEDVFNNYPPE